MNWCLMGPKWSGDAPVSLLLCLLVDSTVSVFGTVDGQVKRPTTPTKKRYPPMVEKGL